MDSRKEEITPFKMQVLMDVAARVVKIMVTGAWHLSWDEMDLVLTYVQQGIAESKARNERGGVSCSPKQEN